MNPRRLTLTASKDALQQIKAHRAWWNKNRKGAPKLFNEGLRAPDSYRD